MTQHAYLFQAKGIQRYILEGGKLKDMVGASELVDSLCRSSKNDLLEKVLNAVGFPEGKRSFSRRAGGVFMLHYSNAEANLFKRFHALWRLSVATTAPGLEFVESHGEHGGDDFFCARDAAYRKAGARENSLASLLPMAGPLVKRAQRTGLAAVPASAKYKEPDEDLDAVTLRKRQVEWRLNKGGVSGGVAGRIAPRREIWPEGAVWPRNMDEEFPFKGRRRWIGVIHADISGLGEMWQRLSDNLKDSSTPATDSGTLAGISHAKSREVEDAMIVAAQYATETVLLPEMRQRDRMMPARPILLGGDDLTMIVRADLAIPFAEAFLEKLEERTVAEHQLSACAGIAFLKASQPFYMASGLAEDLCKYAKSKVKKPVDGSIPKPVPSAIAFHRITSSLIDKYDDILKKTRTFDTKGDPSKEVPGQKYVLTRQPYLVGQAAKPGLARLADLRTLRDWFDKTGVSVGPLRNLESLLFNDFEEAKKGYARWRTGMSQKEGVVLGEFEKPLTELLDGAVGTDLPFAKTSEAPRATPLFDAIDWRELS